MFFLLFLNFLQTFIFFFLKPFGVSKQKTDQFNKNCTGQRKANLQGRIVQLILYRVRNYVAILVLQIKIFGLMSGGA